MSPWRRFTNILNPLLNAAGLLYGLAIVGYLAARILVGERWSWVEIGNSLMPAILFPVVPFIMVTVISRRWKLMPVYIPALLLFAVIYAPYFLPRTVQGAGDIVPLRVMTFNIASWAGETSEISSFVLAANPDIVVFQELLTPVADNLKRELADVYPNSALHTTNTFAVGVGIFSQHRILEDTGLEALSLGGQRSRIELENGQEIVIFNVHPTSPRVLYGFDTSLRSSEIEAVVNMSRSENHPVLLTGDFNITDQTDDYVRIAEHHQDAFYESGAGLGSTFPNLMKFSRGLSSVPPLIRIDYVFYSSHWRAVNAHVLPGVSISDHFPLLAELALNEG